MLDLCTGSGAVGRLPGPQGATSVTVFDICSRAVLCCRTTPPALVGVDVDPSPGRLWALLSGAAVSRSLRIGDPQGTLPVASTIDAVLAEQLRKTGRT